MPRIGDRTRHFTESVIRRMTRVANSVGAINLSQGFPDFDPPEELLRAAEPAGKGPAPVRDHLGGAGFREALARKQSRFMGIDIDPDKHVVVTCGATEAMMAAMMTVCDPGTRSSSSRRSTRTTGRMPSSRARSRLRSAAAAGLFVRPPGARAGVHSCAPRR